MKNIIIIICLLFTFLVGIGQLIPPDKQTHILVGYSIGFSTSTLAYSITENHWKTLAWSMGTTTVIGAAKELYDINGKGTPEVKDLAATMAGGLIGYGVIRLFTIGYPHKHKRKSQSNYTGMKFAKF